MPAYDIVVYAKYTNGYDVEIDGIYYILIKKAKVAEVTYGRKKYNGKISIPEYIDYEGLKYDVKTIGSSAFSNCSELTSISIPNSVTSIEKSAFSGCI